MRNKFNAKKTIVDEITFHSKKEANRYIELKHLADIGLIIWHDKTPLQPKFKLEVNGKHICYYIADFRYYDVGDGKEIIEDVKGYKTAVYKLKKKLFLASYPEFEFIET